jgi:hypothetical protein
VDVEGRPVEAVLEGGAAAGRRNEWERLPEQIVASGSLYSRTDESTGDGAAIYREATLPADGASHESA